MHKQPYEHLDFTQPPRIPRRALLHAGALIALRILWGVLGPAGFFWAMMIITSLLLWFAANGWKAAMRELYQWLGTVSREGW